MLYISNYLKVTSNDEGIFIKQKFTKRREVDVGEHDSKEIDFIARKLDETIHIQVIYELPNNIYEIVDFLTIRDNYKKIVVTSKYYEISQIDGIPIIHQLLSNR